MKNAYGLFGGLSIIGIIGWFTGTKELWSFFAFAVFFQYLFVAPDEMFVANIRKAASRAFFCGQLMVALAMVTCIIMGKSTQETLVIGITLGWSLSIIVFCLSTAYHDWRDHCGE